MRDSFRAFFAVVFMATFLAIIAFVFGFTPEGNGPIVMTTRRIGTTALFIGNRHALCASAACASG